MSSTNRGADRVAHDAYYTPDAVARACVATLGSVALLPCLEPHAGGGAFVRALVAAGAVVITGDTDPAAQGIGQGHASYVGDFLQYSHPHAWIVGNPPYNDAEAHVRHALSLADVGVAFLLRLAFLETAKRRDLWREHPPASVHVLVRRPSFVGGATDSCAYGWFTWRRDHREPPRLGWLEW